jgi:hypothetical protein
VADDTRPPKQIPIRVAVLNKKEDRFCDRKKRSSLYSLRRLLNTGNAKFANILGPQTPLESAYLSDTEDLRLLGVELGFGKQALFLHY